MADTKQIIGGVAGVFLGFAIGGPVGAAKGFLIGIGLGSMYSALKADAPSPGKPQTNEFEFVKAKEGIVIIDLLGTSKISGGNIFFYGNNRTEEVVEDVEGGKGGGSQSVVSGYEYYLTWAQGICLGPVDALYTVFREDHCVWSGELERPASGGVESITLEGMGEMQFFFGTTDQDAPSEMLDLVEDSTLCSARRGLCYAFFNDCSIGSYNRAPNMRFVLRKTPEFDFGIGKHIIEDYKYNAAHATYYILVNKVGLSSSYVDYLLSFDEVADILYHQPLGVSILMDGQQDALSYLETLISHIGGILIWNTAGKLALSLIREEKHTARMLSVDEDKIIGDLDLTRDSWTETVNDVKVQFTQMIIEPEDCTQPTPSLVLLDCNNGHGKGDYRIYGGCPPFKLQWKFSGATDWKHKRTIYGQTFVDICAGIHCGLTLSDRLIRVVDSEDRASNEITITNTAVTALQWGGNRTITYQGSIDIVVIGGKPPYFWSFSGATGLGFWFDAEHTIKELTTFSDVVALYHDGSNCPPTTTILIEDDCSQQVTGVVSGSGFPMEWVGNPDAGDEIEDVEGSLEIEVDGGKPGYWWTTTGNNLWFNADYTQKTILTSEPSVVIYCDGEQCSAGSHYVSCSDTCDNLVSGYITIQDPTELEFDDDSTPDTIAYPNPIQVSIEGGVSPYSWSVVGTGYSLTYTTTTGLSNVLSVIDGTCGVDFDVSCAITVTDACGQEVTFPINHAGGSWDWCGGGSISGGCTSGSTINRYTVEEDGASYWLIKRCASEPGACWDSKYVLNSCGVYVYFGGCPKIDLYSSYKWIC